MGESSRAHINLHGKHAEQTRSGTAGTNQRKHTINGKEPKSLPKRGKQPHGEAKPRLSSLPERSTTTVLLPLLPLPLQAPGRAQQHKETPTTKHKASATISTDLRLPPHLHLPRELSMGDSPAAAPALTPF